MFSCILAATILVGAQPKTTSKPVHRLIEHYIRGAALQDIETRLRALSRRGFDYLIKALEERCQTTLPPELSHLVFTYYWSGLEKENKLRMARQAGMDARIRAIGYAIKHAPCKRHETLVQTYFAYLYRTYAGTTSERAWAAFNQDFHIVIDFFFDAKRLPKLPGASGSIEKTDLFRRWRTPTDRLRFLKQTIEA